MKRPRRRSLTSGCKIDEMGDDRRSGSDKMNKMGWDSLVCRKVDKMGRDYPVSHGIMKLSVVSNSFSRLDLKYLYVNGIVSLGTVQ